MRILTQQQASLLDRLSIKDHGISSEILMENAGKEMAKLVQLFLNDNQSKTIGIVCGKGSNGGDGFAAGSLLHSQGYNITIFALLDKDDICGDSQLFHDHCEKKNIPIFYSKYPPTEEPKFDLMVDAILGIGFSGELREELLPWTDWINKANLTVSADIPTGVDADTGSKSKGAVTADKTITMGYTKLGMTLEPGKSQCGETYAVDIGFPAIENDLQGREWFMISDNQIREILKPLNKTTHKHVQGKVLVIAGSKGMTGAAYLTSLATLRSGAGLVITFAPESLHDIYEKKITEGMTVGCDDGGKGYFTKNNFGMIMEHIDWCDAIAIGPGLGANSSTIELVSSLVKNVQKPMVIDADGLRAFYGNKSLFNNINTEFVITPHLGEMSQLLGCAKEKVRTNLPKAAEEFMDGFYGVLLAKYSPSLVAWETKGCVNSTGNPGLATAGSGDVLTGVIASLIAQGIQPENAAIVGMYIHGKSADRLAKSIGQRGLIASDLLHKIGEVILDYES